MPKLDIEVENLDNVDSTYHTLYTEVDGKFVLTEINGMKSQGDIDRLQGSLIKERSDHKLVKDALRGFGELKSDEVHAQLDRIPELEAAAKGNIDETKMEELLETRMRTKMGPVDREMTELKTKLATSDERIGVYESKDLQRSIYDSVEKAGIKLKILPEAMEDAKFLAERMFEVDQSGNVVVKDGVGSSPGISAEVWLRDLQEKRPHWWADSEGAGSKPGGKHRSNNPWTNKNWNITEQNAIFKENKGTAESLAKSAGTAIGGMKPAAT